MMMRLLRTLLLTLLLTTGAAPALARMVIGVTPATLPGVADRPTLAALQETLAARSGEAVQLRTFGSEAELLDWLLRFRELDAALVGRTLPRSLPAGTLVQLADLPAAVAVTHSGVSPDRLSELQRLFRDLAANDDGRRLLNRLAASSEAAPKAQPRQAVQSAPKPSKPVAAARAPSPPAPKPSEPVVATRTLSPPAPKPPEPAAATRALSPPAPAPDSPAPVPAQTAKPAAAPPAPAKPVPAPEAAPAVAPPPEPPPAKPAAATGLSAAQRSTLLLLAALVVLVAVAIKIFMLVRHWQQRHLQEAAAAPLPGTAAPELQDVPIPSPATAAPAAAESTPAPPAPSAESQPVALRVSMGGRETMKFDFRTPNRPAPQAVPAAAGAPAEQGMAPADKDSPPPRPQKAGKAAATARELFAGEEDLPVIERGRLEKTKAPALLKRCAELAEPAVLRVRTPETEIAVHFAAGQICHTQAYDWRTEAGSRRWSKLGYLMVREGLLSEPQHNQALELVDREPRLRLVAALQRLGFLDLEALRPILTRQAKATIYYLTLFPEGEYRIEADHGTIPAEESIALPVGPLIREAARHQVEWTALRKALPKLGTVLRFSADGHARLEQVSLSVHQHLLLSQVDGRASLGALCSGSTILNYEACRFLYMMVKSGVLEVTPQG